MNRRSASLHIQDSRIVPAYKVIPQRLMSFLMGKERSKRFQHIGTWSPLFLGGHVPFSFFFTAIGRFDANKSYSGKTLYSKSPPQITPSRWSNLRKIIMSLMVKKEGRIDETITNIPVHDCL